MTPGSELLPRLELMAQFRDPLLFLEEEHNRASGREKSGKGRRREGEAEKNVEEREGKTTEERNRNHQAGTGRAECTH